MKIPVRLNGEQVVFEAAADTPLLNVLRRHGCLSVKNGCGEGVCGSCTVLLNKKPVPSCRLPAALARNQQIETLESFARTDDYADIMAGFEKAGIRLCGYCNSGKIFAAWYLIRQGGRPKRDLIAEEVGHLSPCCTDTDTLINGIIYAFDIHNKRTGAP